MNTVTIETENKKSKFQVGDILVSEGGDYHLLCRCATEPGEKYLRYVAMSLKDGHFWKYPKEKIEDAVEKLEFVGRDAKINVSFE